MRDKSYGKESKMGVAYINEAKNMAAFLLRREHRGPGDTIEAAAHRVQTKHGVPAKILMRLRHREVKDMLMSNFMVLVGAYKSACERMEKAYEQERTKAVDPRILWLADLVAGTKSEG